MKILLAIATGSLIGGVLRYLLSQMVQGKFGQPFPFGTLAVNIMGCFCIGLVFGLTEKGSLSADWRIFLATGVLGGFTTFSAFSIESINMMRSGQQLSAIIYISASVLFGLLATFLGFIITRSN
jgi:CrcB protein